jgi:hypothetical protein
MQLRLPTALPEIAPRSHSDAKYGEDNRGHGKGCCGRASLAFTDHVVTDFTAEEQLLLPLAFFCQVEPLAELLPA